MTTPAVRLWYALLVSFIACAIIALAGVWYTNHVQQESERRWRAQQQQSDQRWCSLLTQLTDRQEQAPPQTESGRVFAAELVRLRQEFGCR